MAEEIRGPEMDKKELENTINNAITKSLDNKLAPFYVERETHYNHHQFIGGLIKLTDRVSSTTVSFLVKTFIGAVLVLILMGAAVWMSKNINVGG